MFTGIVEELGIIKGVTRKGNVTRIEIEGKKTLEGTNTGDSISVNGVCLTVVDIRKDYFAFEAMPQTLKITNLKDISVGKKVNLERSLKSGERISGHFVLGHIDCLGLIRKKGYSEGNLVFEIAVPVEFIKYCLPKGSISVDGISLTLMDKKSNTFAVYIIPHTLENTTLSFKGPSDKVNVEFDILAKKS